MALTRRANQRVSNSIWPGFVDAMTALLLVLMFVLTIFMIVQFMLRETITSQDTELDQLSAQVASLAQALGLEQERSFRLETEVNALGGALDEARSLTRVQRRLIDTLTAQAEQHTDRLASFEEQVANLLAAQADAETRIAALLAQNEEAEGRIANLLSLNTAADTRISELTSQSATQQERIEGLVAQIADIERANVRLVTEQEALQLALARARTEIDEGVEKARLAAARREALEALIADLRSNAEKDELSMQQTLAQLELRTGETKSLTAEVEDLRGEMSVLEAALLEARRSDAEATTRITALSNDLEAAYARLLQTETLLTGAQEALSAQEKAKLEQVVLVEELRQRLSETEARLTNEEQARLAELAAAEILRQRLENAEAALDAREQERLAEAAAAEALRTRLRQADDELTAMSLILEDRRREAEETLTLLAAANAARTDLDEKLSAALVSLARAEEQAADADEQARRLARLEAENEALRTTLEQNQTELEERLAAALAAKLAAEQEAADQLTEAERRAVLLAEAGSALNDANARSVSAEQKLALLNAQTEDLRTRLASLEALLDDAVARDAASQVQIQTLGSRLNTALAQAAAEQRRRAELEEAERKRLEAETKDLEKFRSEFFGQLRDIFADIDGVRIVGDRFVFSSEILFQPGDVTLSQEGQVQIARISQTLREIADQIPPEIDWIIRVDGHTDNVPLNGVGKYADNWELSQGRALSVVQYMINSLGISPRRLAAAGFGEYQPINTANTSEARTQNRRIELKFTEK